jgi:hypothetical protein
MLECARRVRRRRRQAPRRAKRRTHGGAAAAASASAPHRRISPAPRAATSLPPRQHLFSDSSFTHSLSTSRSAPWRSREGQGRPGASAGSDAAASSRAFARRCARACDCRVPCAGRRSRVLGVQSAALQNVLQLGAGLAHRSSVQCTHKLERPKLLTSHLGVAVSWSRYCLEHVLDQQARQDTASSGT